jgi:hypothetical protein
MKFDFRICFLATCLAAFSTSVSVAQNAPPPEGFVMINGKVHIVQQGQAIPLDRELTLRVTPGGIMGFDQLPRTLTTDNMLTMDGRVVPAPAGLIVAPPAPKLSAEAARNLDSGVTGENISGLAPAQPAGRPATAAPNPAPARIQPGATTTTTTTVVVPQVAAEPVPQPAPATKPAPPAPPSGTVFDPNAVNDGSIEAAGTGTRKPTQ